MVASLHATLHICSASHMSGIEIVTNPACSASTTMCLLACGLTGSQDRIASGAAAVEVMTHIASTARRPERQCTAAVASSRRCFSAPVISAEGSAVVLDIHVGQLLSTAEGMSGDSLFNFADTPDLFDLHVTGSRQQTATHKFLAHLIRSCQRL